MSLPSLRPGARVLFITNTRIGDVVLSTGLLGLLTDAFPTARITVVAGPLACSLFDGMPGIERVIALRKRLYNSHWFSLYPRLLRPWDLIVDLRGSATAWLLPTRHRRVMSRSDPAEARVVELARLLNADPPPPPRLWIRQRDREAAALHVHRDLGFIAIAPGASRPDKRWPADRFAAMINRLTEPHAVASGLAVVLLGGADERLLIESIREQLVVRAPVPRAMAIVGEPRLTVVAAILERARLYIGNDSGLMHLAAATGVATVGLFGPTPVVRYRPWGERTLVVQPEPLSAGDPSHHAAVRPIADLGVEQVVDRVTRFALSIGLAPGVESGYPETVH
jgi:ADP-heptose:LPS heptosyltransferase